MTHYEISMLASHLDKARAICQQYPEFSEVWDKVEDALYELDQVDVEQEAQE